MAAPAIVGYLETGNASQLWRHSPGVVNVNSTTGLAAIALESPALALRQTIYNLPGLAFQGSLDSFRRDAAPPDAELFRCLRNIVIDGTRVDVGYYTADAVA